MKHIVVTLFKVGQRVDWLRVCLVAALAWGMLGTVVVAGAYLLAQEPLEQILKPLCLGTFYGVLTHAGSEMELTFRFRVITAIMLLGLLNSLRWIAQTLFVSQAILLMIALITLFYGLHTPPPRKGSPNRDAP